MTEYEISSAIDFAWKWSQSPQTSSYPLYEDKRQLEESFTRSICDTSRPLLGYYKNHQLIAVIQFFFIESKKYLQTSGVYISADYEEVLEALISRLRKDYPHYQALFGFPKENLNAANYFTQKGYPCVDACLNMQLKTTDFIAIKPCDGIEKLEKADFDAYAFFHDQYFSNGYWTSSRLREVLEKWHIFVYKVDGKIEGSVFLTTCRDGALEIFGLLVSKQYEEADIEASLLSKALSTLFEDNPNIKKTLFFIDEEATKELDVAKRVGFYCYSRYRCYEVKL